MSGNKILVHTIRLYIKNVESTLNEEELPLAWILYDRRELCALHLKYILLWQLIYEVDSSIVNQIMDLLILGSNFNSNKNNVNFSVEFK